MSHHGHGHNRDRSNYGDNRRRSGPYNQSNQPNKRSRQDAPQISPEQRIKTLLLACGDTRDALVNQIQICVTGLLSDCVDTQSTYNPTLTEFTIDCLLHALRALPTRVHIYSTVLALFDQSLTTTTGHSVRSKALEMLAQAWKQSIEAGQFEEIRVMIRVWIGLASVRFIDNAVIWSTFTMVLNWIEQAANSSLVRDYYLYTLLTMVPWIACENTAEPSNKPEFDEFVERLHSLVASRGQVVTSVVMSSEAEDGTPVIEDTITLLDQAIWSAYQSSKQLKGEESMEDQPTNVWCEDLILRPHLDPAIASQLSTVKPEPFNPFENQTINQSVKAPIIPPSLSIFSSDQWTGESIRYAHPSAVNQSTNQLGRCIMLDYIRDICLIFEAVHKEGAKQLLSLPSKIDYAPLLIEGLIAHVMVLPRPHVPLVYYGSLIIDLFKSEPVVMPPAVGLAVNNLFERLDELEIECFDRLVDWFAFHLSNFAYAWPWVNWTAVLETDEYTPQRIFVQEVFAKITRLSFWARIQQTVPEELLALMPDQPAPAFRFASNAMSDEQSSDQSQLQPQAEKLVQMIREKQPSETITEFLTSIAQSGSETELSHPIQLLMPCLLHCGEKSFSHLFALFDRYNDVLTSTLSAGEGGQAHMMESLGEFWQHSHQHQSIIADKLMQRGLLEPQYLLQWALNQPASVLHQRYVWENVGLALNHCESLGESKPEQTQHSLSALFVDMSRLLKVNATNEGLEAILEARIKAVTRHYFSLIVAHGDSAVVQESLQSTDPRVQSAAQQARSYA